MKYSIYFLQTLCHYEPQADFKASVILLPQPSKCGDYRHEPPGPAEG